MLQNDSILTTITSAPGDSVAVHKAKPQTPYEVLRLLPKDATPAQQDSAIQEWFEPKEIHYSNRPDTLHLPGQEIPRDLKEVNLPSYYRENFFSNNTMYHAELNVERIGVSGAPHPLHHSERQFRNRHPDFLLPADYIYPVTHIRIYYQTDQAFLLTL